MYSELVGKIFDLRIENEELAKAVMVDYVRALVPKASGADIERMLKEYDWEYTLEENVARTIKSRFEK